MPPVGFEPAIPASDRPQTYALDRAATGIGKVKSCNALLRVLPVCIRIYLKAVPRYKFLNLDTCQPGTLYVSEQGCEEPWLFLEAKRGTRAKKFGKHCALCFVINNSSQVCFFFVCLSVIEGLMMYYFQTVHSH
jgi:hypothetical protein